MNDRAWLCILLAALTVACSDESRQAAQRPSAGEDAHTEDSFERGPHGGRMLRDGDFVVELTIFEAGLPPEFRAWVSDDGREVDPAAVELEVQLTRLGGRVDTIGFEPQREFLRGDQVVYEPHSFVVSIEATYAGKRHHWEYESFEGRTRINAEMAEAFDLETMVAGPAVLEETVTLYGRIAPNTERVREVSARFDGAIQSVEVSVGDTVRQGQALAVVESNDSLQSYRITAPIDGVVTERAANPGEQTRGRRLFTLIDTSTVWAELALFPGDRPKVRTGARVTVAAAAGGAIAEGTVSQIGVVADRNQAVTARAVLDNRAGELLPGTYVTAKVAVAELTVPLAVKRSALQSFRDFTVVYAQVGEEYEVRMLELGRQAGDWIEVRGGLEPGTRYVTEGSYLIKADIEKSGAAHDH